MEEKTKYQLTHFVNKEIPRIAGRWWLIPIILAT
jgi:hypothetical protein